MKIAFRVDASVQIGTGHLIRCLTLADELRRCGAQIRFICREVTGALAQRLRAHGHELVLLSAPTDGPRNQEDRDLAHADWLSVTQAEDAAATIGALADLDRVDWLVVDHYALDARWGRAVRISAEKILVIDDLADRRHDCDALIDQNLQPSVSNRYADLLQKKSRCFLGPRFALLRPEFGGLAGKRSANLKRDLRLNIFFGGTDPHNMTSMALDAVAGVNSGELRVDVLIGSDNPHRTEIATLCDRLPNATLHIEADNIAELFASAYLGLGAAGTASWERCCVGLPTIIVSVADNQRSGGAALAHAKAAVYLGGVADAGRERLAVLIQRLIAKPRLLSEIGRRASALVDGRGTQRIVLHMLRNKIELRPARPEDAEMTWAWRNNPRTRKHFHDPMPVSRPAHQTWWNQTLCSPDQSLLVAQCGPSSVGVLRFDCKETSAMVSIYVDPELTGLGLGGVILDQGSQWMEKRAPTIKTLQAEILPQNKASQRLFEVAGYRPETGMTWTRTLGDV